MTFLHPWAIGIGLLAAAAPIVVHLLTRPRPVRMPLSTLRFVRDAVRQRRARHRLRDAIVLACRTLAILLLALTIARPQWGEKPLVSDAHPGDAVRVVILDVSQSMAATTDGVEAIQRAKPKAAELLRYRPGLRANLIVAGASARAVFEQPSANFAALRDELSDSRVLPQRIDVSRALAAASRMLAPRAEGDRRRRELVVVSDFQRSNWASADFAQLPEDTRIQLESVGAAGPGATPPNLAVTRVAGSVRSVGTKSVRLEVDVVNDSPAAEKATVEVALGDNTFRLGGVCAPGRRTTLSGEVELRGLGWQWGEARLVGVDDALAADDRRAVAIEVRPRPTYALVTRQPATQRPSSSHFLECALVPDARLKEKASARVVRIDPAALDRQSLAEAGMILLDHPGGLSDEAIRLLADVLRRGRPIIYVAGELIDATNLKRLAAAAGDGLRMPVEFTPPTAGRSRARLFLTSVREEDSPFGVFGDNLASIRGQLQFCGGLNSRPLEDALASDVLATLSDGSAGMVLTSSDAGALAVLNADLAASNLPRTGVFVPLLSELIEQMFRRNRADRSALCGEPLVVNLPATVTDAAALVIVGPGMPDGEPSGGRLGTLADEGVGVVWHWPDPREPGAYRIEQDGLPVFSIPVTIPAEESRLEPLSGDVLKTRLAGGREVYYRSADVGSDRRDTSWTWFAVACLGCIFVEIAALLAFRA